EPRKWFVRRDGVDLAPRDGERLGGDILGVGQGPRPAHRVREDLSLVRGEERVESGEAGHRGRLGHRHRTTRALDGFPTRPGSTATETISAGGLPWRHRPS